MQRTVEKYYWECPSCHCRYFSEPLTMGVRNGMLVKIHPICPACFGRCSTLSDPKDPHSGHVFGYGRHCNVCGVPRRRFNLIRYELDPKDPTFGNTATGSTTYPTATLGTTSAYTDQCGKDYLAGNLFTLSVPGTIIGMSFYCVVASNVKVGIYADSAGSPAALAVGPFTKTSASASAWNSPSVSPVYLAVASYWLMGNASVNGGIGFTGSGTQKYRALTYGTAWPDPFGTASTGTATYSIYATYVQIKGYAHAYKFTLADGADITSMSFYIEAGASGHLRQAIFDDSGGAPNVLKWESVSFAVTTTAWNTQNISDGTPTSLLAPSGDYHLAWQWDDVTAGPSYTTGSAGLGHLVAQAYGAFSATWSGGSANAQEWSQYVTYEVHTFVTVTDSITLVDSEVTIVNTTDTITLTDAAPKAGPFLQDTIALSDLLTELRLNITDTIALTENARAGPKLTDSLALSDEALGGPILFDEITLVDALVDGLIINVNDEIKLAEFAWHVKGPTTVGAVELPHVLRIQIADDPTISDKKIQDGQKPKRKLIGKPGRVVNISGWSDDQAEIDAMEALKDGVAKVLLLPTGDSFVAFVTNFKPSRNADQYNRRTYAMTLKEARTW